MVKNIVNNRFATKVVIVILIVSLIPTIFNSIFFYVTSSNVVKDNVRASSLQIARQAADSLSFIFSVGSDTSNLIYSNESIQEIVEQDLNEQLSYVERQENNDYLDSLLNSNIYSSSFVRMIYVLKETGKSWGSGTFSEHKLSKYEFEDLSWVSKAREQDGKLVWERLQLDRFSGAGERTEYVLPITRTMKDFDDLSNIAYIQVYLDGNSILEKINKLKLGETGRFFVVNRQGKVMIDPDIDKINQEISNPSLYEHVVKNNDIEFEYKEEGTAIYGVKQHLSNGWTLVGVVPIHEITNELTKIQHISILTSILLGIFIIVIGIIVSNRVTKPIKVLTNQMKLVGAGDFRAKTSVATSDEIGMMSQQFNVMTQQVERLLEQVKQEQIQKKEADLRAVKHRINPHFLFNSLSTIKWLVKFKQYDRANSALVALTRLLEANMGKKGTFVTIEDEIDFIQKFIELLEIRYEQTFHLKVNMSGEVAGYLIPQMLLQPIVENAIFHGIVPTGKQGEIEISARQFADGIEIVVYDNGIGIKEERLAQIQQDSATSKSFVGIGLLHVFDSINLYYSTDSSVDIYSNSGGTVVKLILIPKK
ncbi:putative two-component sensor kinase [Paraliobacillus quinghaiensis]|uniref:Two-component sensor kinase n=1 Tax=Paraliobacillus quinghaiensis TaxID=470815 RepID=A0A917TW26_9BACI|nr:sensor histidine kinase [Paraliobacillus quinghaiensis]GGM38776.1 putative two-component sensor kinase [Paraliobacillus quinghaiensis]